MWTKYYQKRVNCLVDRTGSILAEYTCLVSGAARALAEADLAKKTALVNEISGKWKMRQLSLNSRQKTPNPERPGRPAKPELISPRKMPRRSMRSTQGMVAMLHSIAHIELNAIDLALDIVARFGAKQASSNFNDGLSMPRSFFDDWMMVAFEEAKHFNLLCARLKQLNHSYGDLPAHDGLWEAAQKTEHDLVARLAVVPLVLEARGLDITPSILDQLEDIGDKDTARIFRIIYEDEKGHVAVGAKWFRFLCYRQQRDPAATFQLLIREHFRGGLKPPFNDKARARSGITPSFYRALSPKGN